MGSAKTVDGSMAPQALRRVQYDSVQRSICIHRSTQTGATSGDATFRFEQVARVIPKLKAIVGRASNPAVEWQGDQPAKPRCCRCGQAMPMLAGQQGLCVEFTCIECGGSKSECGRGCNGCHTSVCLECSPHEPPGRGSDTAHRAGPQMVCAPVYFLDLRENPAREVRDELLQLVARLGGAL